MKRANVIAIVACLAIAAVLLIAVLGPVLQGSGAHKPEITKLDLELPEGYSVSSSTSYRDTLVLCCHTDDSNVDESFYLLTYRHGDAAFQVHPFMDSTWPDYPVEFTISPYDRVTTSLLVVNGTLYLFYYTAYTQSTGEKGIIWTIDTEDWTLHDQSIIPLPLHMNAGEVVSDGESMLIIELSQSSGSSQYDQANYTIFRLNPATGDLRTVATVLRGSFYMRAVSFDNSLALIDIAWDNGRGPETDPGALVSWNTTLIYDLDTGALTNPKGPATLDVGGLFPASDGNAVYFFNPINLTWDGQMSQPGGFNHQVWKLDGQGSLTKVDLVLPDQIAVVVPTWVGNGFFLIDRSAVDTIFWWCTV